MRRALALAAVLGAVLAGAASAAPPNAADLEAELVCPVCETTLDQSNAPVAERMKTFIRVRIAAGDSEQEIKDALVAEFGTEVLAEPPGGGFGLLAWLLPLGALVGGAIAVGLLIRAWSRRDAQPEPVSELGPELDRLVDDELARFDGVSWTSIPVAFFAGMVSFLAPCVLPLVPAYLSAVSAVDADQLGQPGNARRVMRGSVPFVLGFTAFFVLLGIGAALVGGRVLGDQFLLERIAGFVLVVFGLAFMGLLPWPERLVGAGLLQEARGRGSRALLGGAFAVCAAPCIGPVLAAILVLAGSSDTAFQGAALLGVYSLGLARAVRTRRRPLHAGDVGVPLAARPLPRDPGRRRSDHGRPRATPLLRALLRAPRLPEPLPRVARPRAGVLDARRRESEGACRGDVACGRDVVQDRVDIDPAMTRAVAVEASLGLHELPLAAVAVSALGVKPRDGDVDEPLEEVALGSRRRAPLVLECLVRLEVRAVADQLESLGERHPPDYRRPSPLLLSPRGDDPAGWGRPLLSRQAGGASSRAPARDER